MKTASSTSERFLRGDWKNLFFLNYAVDPAVLLPHLPPECELDLWDGSPYVSIVALQFLNANVWGLKLPLPQMINFPQINLRFYVTYHGRRGVRFLKEYVPSSVMTFGARSLYNEPYEAAEMSEKFSIDDNEISGEYKIKKNGEDHQINVKARNLPYVPPRESMEYFFKERKMGVTLNAKKETIFYNVYHSNWRVVPVDNYELKLNPVTLFGPEFDFLTLQKPASVFLAEGSAVRASTIHQEALRRDVRPLGDKIRTKPVDRL